MECQNHLQDAVDSGYLSHAEFTSLNVLAQRTCGAVASHPRTPPTFAPCEGAALQHLFGIPPGTLRYF